MASTTRKEVAPADELQQETHYTIDACDYQLPPVVAGKHTRSEADDYVPPVPSTVAAFSAVDLARTASDLALVASSADATDADTAIPHSFPAAADGGKRQLHQSDVDAPTAEVSKGGGSAATAAAGLQEHTLRQGNVYSRSTSIESDKCNRLVSASNSGETSNVMPSRWRSKPESSSSRIDSSPLESTNGCSTDSMPEGSTSRQNSRPCEISSSPCNSIRSSNSNTRSSSCTAGGRGKRYVVVSRPASGRQHQRQPLRQDIHVLCRNGINDSGARPVNFVEPKYVAGNTVYKVGFSSSYSSRNTGSSTIQSLPIVCTATRSRRPQFDDDEGHFVVGTAVAAPPPPPTDPRGAIREEASVGSNRQENSTGNEAVGTPVSGECASQTTRGTTGIERSSIKSPKHNLWFARYFAASLSSSVGPKGAVPAGATTNFVTSVSHPQLVQKPGDSQQDASRDAEARLDEDEDVVRKKSSYLNVSLNSISDELTIISYNIQMLVDCCSLNVNWWSREQQLVQYVRKIARERNADMVVFQECWSGTSHRLIRSLATGEDGVAFPFQTRVLGADSGPPYYRRAWGDCYCTMAECGRDCCSQSQEDEEGRRCLCCGPCCGCCCFAPLFAARGSKSTKAVQQQQQDQQKKEADTRWTSVRGAFSRLRRNGGVLIVSKWPLVERHAYVFKNGALPDCLENKGAVLVRVNKCGRVFNVVGTHLQSGYSNNHVRLAQFKELAAWLRSGMEACEQEFFSVEADDAVTAPPAAAGLPSSRATEAPDNQQAAAGARTAAASSTAAAGKGGGGSGRGATEGGAGTPAAAQEEKGVTEGKQGLPRDLIKASEPLIICGDLNTRLLEDRDTLMEALRADCLNCRLCFPDFDHASTTYDTQLNSTCAANCRSRKKPVRELLDYFLLSNDHGGSIARWQETITEPAECPLRFRHFRCLCVPLWGTETVHHCSDHLPVCVTIRHSGQND